MSQMKAWGFKIAAMLFETHHSVDDVVDMLSKEMIENPRTGKLEEIEVDKDWLREQVMYVKSHRRDWGYSYGYQLEAKNKRDSKIRTPINFGAQDD